MFAHSKFERGGRLDIENVGAKKVVDIKRDNDIFNRYTSLVRKGVRVNSVPQINNGNLTMNINNTGIRRYRRPKPIFDEKKVQISKKKHVEQSQPKQQFKGKKIYPRSSSIPYAVVENGDGNEKHSSNRPNSVIKRSHRYHKNECSVPLNPYCETENIRDVKNKEDDIIDNDNNNNNNEHMMTMNDISIPDKYINDINQSGLTTRRHCSQDKLCEYDINEQSKRIYLQKIKTKLEKRIQMTNKAAMSLVKCSFSKNDDLAWEMENTPSQIPVFENKPHKRMPKQPNKALNKDTDSLTNREIKKYYKINDELIQKKHAAMNNTEINNKCFKEMIELAPYTRKNQKKKNDDKNKRPLFKL